NWHRSLVRKSALAFRKGDKAMASVPIPKSPPPVPAETLEERFERLAAKWREETAYLSSSTAMFAHPAYQEIISLGQGVVPLLLRALTKEPDHWPWALA